jgi:hypothetical protein
MPQDEFHADVYGDIRNGTTARDMSGTNSYPHVSKYGGYRAYLSYDTSPIPDAAVIEEVAFVGYWSSSSSEPVGAEISDYAIKLYSEHDRIGGALNWWDWGLTTYELRKSWGDTPPWPGAWTLYPSEANINKDGDTDYELRGDSVYIDPPGGPDFLLVVRIDSNWYSHLDVTYLLPGWFNRWNWKLPALPGFSHIVSVVALPSGWLRVKQRFYPRRVVVGA